MTEPVRMFLTSKVSLRIELNIYFNEMYFLIPIFTLDFINHAINIIAMRIFASGSTYCKDVCFGIMCSDIFYQF